VIPIVYGNMRKRAMDLALQGRVYLGSTLTSGDPPIWYCKGCDNELPPEMGSLWRSSRLSEVHSQVLLNLYETYKPLRKMERKILSGRKGLQTIISTVFRSIPKELRLWRTKDKVHMLASVDNETVSLPSPPVHLFINILLYIRTASQGSDPDISNELNIAFPIDGEEIRFLIKIQHDCGAPIIVIRKKG